MMRRIEREPNGRGVFQAGQDLVVAGAIGKKGVKTAVETKREMLEKRFCKAFMRNLETALDEKLNLDPVFLTSIGATEWEYVEEGGILAALWNISGAYGRGITFSLLNMPVKQELIEVCELTDLNPYRLWCGDCVLLVTDHGADMVNRLAENGIFSAVIGKVEKGIARKMTGVSGTGYLERPQPDEIYKLIEEVSHAGQSN